MFKTKLKWTIPRDYWKSYTYASYGARLVEETYKLLQTKLENYKQTKTSRKKE